MNDQKTTKRSPSGPRSRPALLQEADQCSVIEVQAVTVTETQEAGGFSSLPRQSSHFSVCLIKKPEQGGVAECIGKFSHPDDAIAWASDLASQMALDCRVQFDIQDLKSLPITVGESVFVPLDFNGICGTVQELKSDGVAVLQDCFDLFGPLNVLSIELQHCQRFWERPRVLGMSDLSRSLA